MATRTTRSSNRSTLRIVDQPPLDALNVGFAGRLGALVKGILPF